MSAILSSDDLNDFISPGVACIKPVETLPPSQEHNPYEVTTEYQVAAQNAAPASISLTDCLACSGCVTSAEAVLVSLQSHNEVLNMLDGHPNLDSSQPSSSPAEARIFVASVSPQVRASIAATYGISEVKAGYLIDQFLSGPQGLRAGGQKLSGFQYVVDTNRLRDVCLVLGAAEVETALQQRATTSTSSSSSSSSSSKPTLPILSSACPGWVCYAEKTHPHVLPHLSSLKSAQALSGTLLKSVLSKALGIHPSQIWHLAIMPCFDKKLEASRAELTNEWWQSPSQSSTPVRDVDCVITSRELLSLAAARDIQLSSLPLEPVPRPDFPEPRIAQYLFPRARRHQSEHHSSALSPEAGSSDGFLYFILKAQQAAHANSQITIQRGRNADVVEYTLHTSTTGDDGQQQQQQTILTCARYYGFRNIQNLVRKLKPARQSRLPGAMAARRMPKDSGMTSYAYVEVMACPGGCTNGGGQIRVEDAAAAAEAAAAVAAAVATPTTTTTTTEGLTDLLREGGRPQAQKEWLRRVDEAYFSADDDSDADADAVMTNGHDNNDNNDNDNRNKNKNSNNPADTRSGGDEKEGEVICNINIRQVHQLLRDWEEFVGVPRAKLAYTTFRAVESDVGKTTTTTATTATGTGTAKKTKVKASQMTDAQRIANIAGLSGGGW